MLEPWELPINSIYEVPELSPGFLLWQTSTSWRTSIEAVLRPLGLTHPQFVVLATLGWLTRNGERVSQANIGKMAKLDPNTISQIVRGLELKGLIKRERSSDGRAKNPILTPAGSKMLIHVLPLVEAGDAQFFSTLNDKEKACMIGIFQKITSA